VVAGKPIDNLSIIVSANTSPLAADLQKAGRYLDEFNKKAQRVTPSRDKDGLPVLQQWKRAGGRQFGSVEPSHAGRMFGEANKDQMRAGFRAARERLELERAAAAKKEVLDRQLTRLASGEAREQMQRNLKERGGDRLAQYGKPGILARFAGAVKRQFTRGPADVAADATPAESPVAQKAKETDSSFLSLAKTGLKLGVGLAAVELGLGGVAAGFQKVKESVQLAGELEQTTLAFEVMLKSAEKARDVVMDVRRFAASTPFGQAELFGATRQLSAYGLEAEQLLPTLRMLGDVSAAFGKDLPIGRLTYLYGTLQAQQRAYAIDVRGAGQGHRQVEGRARAARLGRADQQPGGDPGVHQHDLGGRAVLRDDGAAGEDVPRPVGADDGRLPAGPDDVRRGAD
jgi:hypothetical protein